MPRALARPALLLAVLTLVVGACSSSKTTTSAPSGPSGTTITIKDFKFAPPTLSAKVGEAITVKNSDGTRHTLTADDMSFDTGDISGQASATVKPTKAGDVAFHCKIHDYMKGTIKVA